ncbi:MAG: hypothetical protein ACC700_18550, partial [Anaerolineales bacterium]
MRGSIVPSSPNVDALVGELIDNRADIEPSEWLTAFDNAAVLPRKQTPFDYFDSDEEKQFYSTVLTNLASEKEIRSWTVPQI